jgi:hypothetical protein
MLAEPGFSNKQKNHIYGAYFQKSKYHDKLCGQHGRVSGIYMALGIS